MAMYFRNVKEIILLVAFCICCSIVSVKAQEAKKNILLICIDDLRPELNSFGVDYISSPNIDQLANEGRVFENHYVNSPSCGPSRYTMLTGTYGPPQNNALFLRAEKMNKNKNNIHSSMPEWFRNNGYTTVSVGKVSHHPGGRGGKTWDDNNIIEMPNAWDKHLMPVGEWETPVGAMHGLANGETRKAPSQMDVYQSVEGSDMIYPDGLIVEEGLRQLEDLTSVEKPFFLAIGVLKPHLPFGAPKKYLDMYKGVELPPIKYPNKPEGISTWHKSGEFMKYNLWDKNPNEDEEFAYEVRKHYAACVSYADAQVGKIIKKLKETGAYENTIIVLWGDHGWNLGEHAIWGKHNLFEEGLRSPLIVSYSGINKPGEKTNALVESSNIFPTLCELTKVTMPDFVDGVSMVPIIKNPQSLGISAVSYNGKATTLRTNKYRLIVHKNGAIELYDHTSKEKETLNIAKKNPQLVTELTVILQAKYGKELIVKKD